jgi:hypothetical protein
LYWIRVSFSGSLKATTALKYIGYKFAADEDVGMFYPELTLSNVIAQFKAGKTNWDEQHFAAANEIIKDLQVKNTIVKPNQILDWRTFRNASIHKLAEIVFNAFGDDFKDNRKTAQEYYGQAMKLVYANIDRNLDGNLSNYEATTRQGFLKR